MPKLAKRASTATPNHTIFFFLLFHLTLFLFVVYTFADLAFICTNSVAKHRYGEEWWSVRLDLTNRPYRLRHRSTARIQLDCRPSVENVVHARQTQIRAVGHDSCSNNSQPPNRNGFGDGSKLAQSSPNRNRVSPPLAIRHRWFVESASCVVRWGSCRVVHKIITTVHSLPLCWMVRVALEPTRNVALWHCHHRQEAPRGNLGMTYEGTQACFFPYQFFFLSFFPP